MRESQDSIRVSKQAIILIKKDLEYCDSLKVAYNSVRDELYTIVDDNISLYKELDNQSQKNIGLSEKIEQLEKTTKKQQKSLLWFGGGVGVGTILMFILMR